MNKAAVLLLGVLGALGGSFCFARTYRCDWAVVGTAGGAMNATGLRVGATAGQTAAGLMAATGPGTWYRAFIGFWQADYGAGIIEQQGPASPAELVTRFEAALPNPAPGRAQVHYLLAAELAVSLTVHDITGRRVRTLAAGTQPAGRHTLVWRGDDDAGRELANGVYFCRFAAGDVRETSKLILAR